MPVTRFQSRQSADAPAASCRRHIHPPAGRHYQIPIAPAAPPMPNFPRLRALALFGRRPPQGVEGFVMPASKNLHKNGSRVLLDHLIGGRAGGNTKKEAPLLPAGRNRDDNWMVAERKFERTDVGQCFDRLNASCWIVDPYRHARDPEMDRHAVLAAQAFAPHGQLERAVAVL
jgi:hypothetical protein